MTVQWDLVVLVADADAEAALKALLAERVAALNIRPITFQIIRDPDHDAGVFTRAHDLLRPYLRQVAYALVLLDREGSGVEHRSAPDIELELEQRLWRNGWLDVNEAPRASAIVLDPELEIWVWSRSPHVAEILGLSPDVLQDLLSSFALASSGKPQRPKEAMYAALRRSKRPLSASIFRELAVRVSLRSEERAFDKLRQTLQLWFLV